jgi:processing peptidase subunit beta
VAEQIGRELLVYGRRMPKAEMFARIDAVDAETVGTVTSLLHDQYMAAGWAVVEGCWAARMMLLH